MLRCPKKIRKVVTTRKRKCFHSDFGNKIVNSKPNHEADSESKLISQKMVNSKFIRKTDAELIVNTL